MLIPKFKIERDARFFITEKYITNGHWLITRQVFNGKYKKSLPTALKRIENDALGAYYFGKFAQNTSIPNIDHVIPRNMSAYTPISNIPTGVKFKDQNIQSYIFKNESVTIGINPNYTPLMQLGECRVLDKISPITVYDGSDLLALIMPMRLDL